MRKKRVLLIATNDLGKSGVPEVIMSIVRLLNNEFIFDVIITRDNTYYKKEFESFGGKVFLLKEKEIKSKFVRVFYKLFCSTAIVKKALKPIYKNHYDIVHSFKDLEGGIYLKEAKRNNVPIRISHCSRQYLKPKKITSRIYDKHLRKMIFKYSSKLVAISTKSGFSLFGRKHRFDVLYNTYNEKEYFFESINNQDSLCLTQIGTFLPIKNQLFSVKILQRILAEVPSARLQLIGRVYDRDYYNQVLHYISKNNLSENIDIFNWDIDQKFILEKTTFSLIPSIAEGLSLVAIESQAKGIKCFASKGVPEEVSCGGIEFLNYDINLWSSKIISEYHNLRSKRKQYNMTKFSNKSFRNRLLEIYNM